MSTADCLEYLEARSSHSWNEAADRLVQAVTAKGLRRGQSVWVDAHNNGPHGEAIFMACWSPDSQTDTGMQTSPLSLAYHAINIRDDWPVLYDQACLFCCSLHLGQLVSVTCSCNEGGKKVCYVWYDAGSGWDAAPTLQPQWTAVSAGSWLPAGQAISQRLAEVAPARKILSIDAHNCGPTGDALFVAFYDAQQTAPTGRFFFTHQNASYAWDQFYRRALTDATYFGKNTISITSSCNENNRAVTFAWYYLNDQDVVMPVLSPLTNTLSVMSFNIWCDGGDSLCKTCEVIELSRPDIVSLQECAAETAIVLAGKLGMYFASNESWRAPVLSRWPVEPLVDECCDKSPGFKISPPNAPEIAIYSVHLPAYPYPPYELHHKHKSIIDVEASEHKVQLSALSPVLRAMRPRLAGQQIVLLSGDFNAASHVDYPCGPIFPCSTACAALGLIDSFDHARTAGVASGPASTWTAKAEEEPNGIYDRIDFIYFSGNSGLVVESSCHLDGSNSCVSEYPSDHRAVLTKFRLPDSALDVDMD
eukprot:TRINITY_DN44471_c0_g1_i1.p1 TRINITY_DN44471_c0_g1~~TRINITY_DN44471_c0_g1_i1.p1  ORF type:complete len:553 (-),score=60.28 TRINITY_DN44471_c0_g1_i1:110-1708(-)